MEYADRKYSRERVFPFCAIEENSNYIDVAYKLTIIIEKYYKHYRNNQFAYMSRM